MIADGVLHKIENSTIHHFFQLFQEIKVVCFIHLLCHTQKIEIDSHLPTVRLETASERRRAPLADLPGSKISAACRSWLARRSLYVREDGAGAKRTIKIRSEESRRRRLETASERRRAPPADLPGSKISAACRSWLARRSLYVGKTVAGRKAR